MKSEEEGQTDKWEKRVARKNGIRRKQLDAAETWAKRRDFPYVKTFDKNQKARDKAFKEKVEEWMKTPNSGIDSAARGGKEPRSQEAKQPRSSEAETLKVEGAGAETLRAQGSRAKKPTSVVDQDEKKAEGLQKVLSDWLASRS
mmetsp:Transcript_42145/g.65980  ORF Transcript_42145/g.65980 Transcript_42145/m.65980 type:complete len:144 (-) Transcript_42145:150-581(-)